MTSAEKHLVAGKRIFVAGAGIGGLSFSASLQRLCSEQGVEPLPKIRLFERDQSAEVRVGQGYSLSVRSDSGGLQVIHRLGVLSQLMQYREPGDGFNIARHTFYPLVTAPDPSPPGLPIGRLRISRSRLRQGLLSQLPPESVTFNKICTNASLSKGPDGITVVTLHFNDGTSDECDILVIADGASSKLRAALRPEETKNYRGVCMITGRTDPFQKMPSRIASGQWRIMSPTGVGLFVSPLDLHSAQWNLSFRAPDTLADKLNEQFKDPTAAQAYLDNEVRQMAAPFAEPMPTLLRHTQAHNVSASNINDKMPHSNRSPIVFIGDACHPMSPFSGNGANMALRDGFELAEQLVSKTNSDLKSAVEAYDAQAAPRTRAAILVGRKNLSLVHSSGLQQLKFTIILFCVGWLISLKAWWRGDR